MVIILNLQSWMDGPSTNNSETINKSIFFKKEWWSLLYQHSALLKHIVLPTEKKDSNFY